MSSRLLERPEFVQSEILEHLVLFMASKRYDAHVHAAVLVRDGKGILLTGSDGAGKSTLAYACVKAGFQIVAEDVAFVSVQEDQLWAWGRPWHLHLLPDAVQFFPEIADYPQIHRGGETKYRIDVEKSYPNSCLTNVQIVGAVMVSRSTNVTTTMETADVAHVQRSLSKMKGDPSQNGSGLSQVLSAVGRLPIAKIRVGSHLVSAAISLANWIDTLKIELQ